MGARVGLVSGLVLLAVSGCAVDTAKEGVVAPELSSLGSADSASSPNQGELVIGARVDGDLSRRLPYHYYTFTLEQTGTYFLDLASREGADLYLLLYRQTEGGWNAVATNDDCYRGTLNACLEQSLEPGTYAALASTYQYLSRGRRPAVHYSLLVSCRDCVDCSSAEDPKVHYVGDAESCTRIRFACADGQTHFSNSCGCGCIDDEQPACVVAGCSSQLCVEEGETPITTCEWRPEYACYQRLGTCERQDDGACSWTPTDELNACIEDTSALDDCRTSGCAAGHYCSLCWANYACIPDGAVC